MKEPPAVWVRQHRGRGAGGNHQRAEGFPPRERRWPGEFREGEEADERHAEHALEVQIAPQRDRRHHPPERPRGARGDGALNQPAAGRDPREGGQMGTWNHPRFEHEEPEYENRHRRQRRRLHAAREVDERERRRNRGRLECLDAHVAAEPPRRICARVGEPRRVVLAVVGIGEAEDVGAHEPPRQVLSPLRQMPSQVRLIDRPKAHERRGRDNGQHHDERALWPCHADNLSSKSSSPRRPPRTPRREGFS